MQVPLSRQVNVTVTSEGVQAAITPTVFQPGSHFAALMEQNRIL